MEQGRLRSAFAVMALGASLAACSSPALVPPSIGAHDGTPMVEPSPSRPAPDQCGAAEMQYLVGRPRTDIPVPIDPRNRRVTCTACAMTMDYSPRRLNILYDEDTGTVREVRCG